MAKVLDFNLYKRIKGVVRQLDQYFVCIDCGCDAFRVSPDGEAQCKECGKFLFEPFDDEPEGA